MTEIDAEKLRALDAEATPAPWVTQGVPYDGLKGPIILGGPDRIYVAQTVYDMQSATEIHAIDEDTELIAYLRNLVPAILAMAEENKRLREALGDIANESSDRWARDLARRALGKERS
jgi:hypothetical protein